MAPRPTYDPPQVQLGHLLVTARRRGLSFEAWWDQAVRQDRSLVMTNHPNPPVGCVRWPTDRNDRRAWQAAIYGTKEAWRGVYEGRPASAAERAVGMLGESINALGRVAEERCEAELVGGLEAHEALPSAA